MTRVTPDDRKAELAGRVLRIAAGTFAVTVLVVALTFSLFRLVVPAVPQYRGQVEDWASEMLGAPVAIGGLDLRWRGLRPEVVLGDVQYVSGDAGLSFAVRELRIGLSYRSLFRARRLTPARIVMVEPDLTWMPMDQPPGDAITPAWPEVLRREERRGEVVIIDGRFELHDGEARRIPFEGIDGRVRSDGRRHELEMRARVAGLAGRPFNIEGSAQGMPGSTAWRATMHIDAQRIDLPALQALTGDASATQGTVDVAMRVEMAGREASVVELDIGLSGMSWHAGRVDRAAFEVYWTNRDGGWGARLDNFTVHRSSGVSENGPLHLEVTGDEVWRLHGRHAWVQDLVLLGVLASVQAGGFPRVASIDAHGRLTGFELAVHRPGDDGARWSLRADGERLAWSGSVELRIPGVNGLDVSVSGDQRSGEVTFKGDINADFPWLFRAPLPQVGLSGRLEWSYDDGRLVLAMPEFQAGNDDLKTLHARGELSWPGTREDAHIELTADFTGAHMTRGSPYLPTSIMHPALVEWLDGSVRDGTASGGRLEWRGPLVGFPYRDDEGLFLIEFDASDMRIDFDARWPSLSDATGRIRFRNNGFSAMLDNGWLAAASLESGTVRMDDYRTVTFTISGGFEDTLPALQTAFLATPIGMDIGDWLALGETDGHGRLDLDIVMPLRDLQSVQVNGGLTMRDSAFSPGGTELRLTGITGRLDIDGTKLKADRIAAQLFGRPLRISVEDSGTGDAHSTRVLFAGSLDSETLEHAGIAVGTGVMSGSANWNAVLTIPRIQDAPPTLEVGSDLRGIALDLPSPLGKAAGDAWDAKLETVLDASLREVRLSVHSRLQASMKMRAADTGWDVEAASVRIGPGETPPGLPDSGLVLAGWIGSWRVGDGEAVLAPHGGMYLHTLDMQIAELEGFGQSLGQVHVRGTRNRAGWHLDLEGDRIAGVVDLPEDPRENAPVRLDLERMHLEQALLREAHHAHFDPRTIPAIAFHVRDFSTGRVQLGEINGMLRPVRDGIALDGFSSTTPTQRIEVEGSWLTDGMHHSTTVRGTVDSTDVRRTLTALGFNASVEASAGHLDGEVSWPDVPHGDVLGALDGNLQVRIERGNLSEVTPGAGRMFGLMSLNALPRRLALDFSDVFRRGLSFDNIRGNFRIERGQAYTDDLTLTGPAARIEITGRTGLAQRDYEQTAVVTGSLASSLTLAGALAGGPGVGAALLIATELLKAPLEDMARARYRISGNWLSPSVERLPDPR